MELKKLTGIILKTAQIGDYDKMISVFSDEFGCIKVMAKGVRRFRSHRSFHIDLFNHVQMELEQSQKKTTAMPYLREISTLNPFSGIKNNPPSYSAACVIALFLLRLLPSGSPQKKLYGLTYKTFEALNQTSDPKRILTAYFLKSTRLMGYLPNSIPKSRVKNALANALNDLDDQFTLYARRTLGIFSNLDKTRSN